MNLSQLLNGTRTDLVHSTDVVTGHVNLRTVVVNCKLYNTDQFSSLFSRSRFKIREYTAVEISFRQSNSEAH